MIPQLKPDEQPHQPDPWGHVEQRRQPAANDAAFNDDGKSKGNWTMLLATICGIVGVVLAVLAAGWFLGGAVYRALPDIAAHIAAEPKFYAVAVVTWVAMMALAIWWQRRLDKKRMQKSSALRHVRNVTGGKR